MDEKFWNERYSGTELIWTDRPNMFLVRETQDLSPGTVVDLACGEGRNAIWLAEQGWTATGIDFSAVGLEKGKALAVQRGVSVAFEQHDATTWKSDQKFDLVAMFYLQLPPPQRRTALEGGLSAVGEGGTFLLVAHDADNLEHGVGGPQDPETLYSVEEVVRAAEGAGFEIVTAEQARRPVQTQQGERDAIDTIVRAVRHSA
jgi:SAM-dependent methyltransferase